MADRKRKARPWRRMLWAVELVSPRGNPVLIGNLWHGQTPHPYPGEPTHALTFTRRTEAREWCRQKMAKYAGRQDRCVGWRFRPRRVLETVRVM
jgi:hypothetical protein